MIVFHLLDPCERFLAQGGRVRVLDMEDRGELTTDVESIRADYLRRIERWCDDLQDICLHQGVDRLELTTDTPPANALVDYLVSRRS